MGIFGKRKSEAQNEDLVCSPKKQVRTSKETIPISKVNVGENVTSSSEESDSDDANEFLSKCIEDSEEDDSQGSFDSEDDVESIDDDDDDEENDDVGQKSKDNSKKLSVDNKVNAYSESAKVKLIKGSKNALGNLKDRGNTSDSSEESSDSSSSEDSVDGPQEVKNNSTDNATSKLKVTSVKPKQQPNKKRKNVIQSSDDDSSSDDSSVDDNIKLEEDKNVVKTNSGIEKSSKTENVSSSGTDSDDSDESSEGFDNESDGISTSGGNPKSNVTQIHSKHQLDTKVKQDIKGKTKESVQESDSSDSDDDDNDDSDNASMKDEDDKEADDESEDELVSQLDFLIFHL